MRGGWGPRSFPAGRRRDANARRFARGGAARAQRRRPSRRRGWRLCGERRRPFRRRGWRLRSIRAGRRRDANARRFARVGAARAQTAFSARFRVLLPGHSLPGHLRLPYEFRRLSIPCPLQIVRASRDRARVLMERRRASRRGWRQGSIRAERRRDANARSTPCLRSTAPELARRPLTPRLANSFRSSRRPSEWTKGLNSPLRRR